MLKNFEKLFGGQYLERGRDYYKEGAVKNVLKEGNTVTANLQGNSLYRVNIDLKTREMECSCPCDFNCKHMAAVMYALRANKADDLENNFCRSHRQRRIETNPLENP